MLGCETSASPPQVEPSHARLRDPDNPTHAEHGSALHGDRCNLTDAEHGSALQGNPCCLGQADDRQGRCYWMVTTLTSVRVQAVSRHWPLNQTWPCPTITPCALTNTLSKSCACRALTTAGVMMRS